MENTHVFYENIDDYISYLGVFYIGFEEGRYTLNGNLAEVELPAVIDVDEITYIAWNNQGAWRFYYVRSSVYQSGYGIFNLEVDLWATYISRARLSNIRVTRCNRNVGNGIYDPIPATLERNFTRLGGEINEDDLAIIYVVAYATGTSSILVNNSATALGIFANEFSGIGSARPDGVSKIDWAIELVSGIFSAQATIGDLDANVLKAYIVPKEVLSIKNVSVPIFKVKTPTFNGTLTPSYEVAPFIYPVLFNIDIDPNKKYYVGTKHAGVEIVRTTQPTQIYYNYIVKQDGLQVIVQQGDKMLDITDAFQVGLTSNDGNFTATERVARSLQIMGGIASGVFQIMDGGAGYVTGALATTNALTKIVEQGNARYTQGGDGVSTYRALLGGIMSPYYMQTNTSIDNEKANARLYGATFNQQVESIDYIFSRNLLGNGTLTDTYLSAEIRVDGVPTDARDVIASSIRSGVYCIKL